jgi:hypothetical protein
MAALGVGRRRHRYRVRRTRAGIYAARLVWMLRATGHDAALLNGGLVAYDGGARPRRSTRPQATFTPRPWPADRLADIEDAAAGSFVVLDAREQAPFRGDIEPIDPRPGHIPGARNLPCRENVDASSRFLAVPELRERFAAVGCHRGHVRDLVLWVGRYGLPQPARARALPAWAPAGSTPARGRSTAAIPAARRYLATDCGLASGHGSATATPAVPTDARRPGARRRTPSRWPWRQRRDLGNPRMPSCPSCPDRSDRYAKDDVAGDVLHLSDFGMGEGRLVRGSAADGASLHPAATTFRDRYRGRI